MKQGAATWRAAVCAAWLVSALCAAACDASRRDAAGAPAPVSQVRGAASGAVLQGPPGPDLSDELAAEYPRCDEVDAWLAGFDDYLTWDEADALLVPRTQLPDEATWDAWLTHSELEAFDAQALTRDQADELLVSFDLVAPLDDLVSLDEASALLAPRSALDELAGYATDADLPDAGAWLKGADAAATYALKAALDDIPTWPQARAAYVPVDEPLDDAGVEAVRAETRRQWWSRPCPEGMVPVADFCIDAFEASVWSEPDCTGQQYGVEQDDYPADVLPDSGSAPGSGAGAYACSVEGVAPSRFLTWFQAASACAASGKRLCAAWEWRAAAAGSPSGAPACHAAGPQADTDVAVASAVSPCASAWGMHDATGSVAEWVADWQVAGVPAGSPDAAVAWGDAALGAVRGVDGSARSGAGAAAWQPGKPAAVVLGGSWADGQGAGPLATDWTLAPDASSPGVGFRCCRSR